MEKVSFVCGILPIHANVQVVVGAIVEVVVMVKVVEVLSSSTSACSWFLVVMLFVIVNLHRLF